ncbi:hypothetical protein AC1031_002637 [Aphanomyces cochlioides]|nr:hypothetical protein AC1031_002637 [Aphanomyces cochlioides]
MLESMDFHGTHQRRSYLSNRRQMNFNVLKDDRHAPSKLSHVLYSKHSSSKRQSGRELNGRVNFKAFQSHSHAEQELDLSQLWRLPVLDSPREQTACHSRIAFSLTSRVNSSSPPHLRPLVCLTSSSLCFI